MSIWSVIITATAVNRTHASTINALIPARFRMFADTEPIVPRSIIARYAPVSPAVQATRISDVLLFNIARVTRSVRPGQLATGVYAQVSEIYNRHWFLRYDCELSDLYLAVVIRSALWKHERLHRRSTLYQWSLPAYLSK